MAAAVPAVERTRRVLDLLASEPERAFRGADVARETDMHRASCFSLLTALVDQGLVRRDEDGPTYRLGPVLVGLGDAAGQAFGPVPEARREMLRLVDEMQCGALLSTRSGDEILTIDSVDLSDAQRSAETEPGGRAPLRAPRGTIFWAWSARADLDRWIAKAGLDEAEARAVVRTAAALRARGYSLGADVELGMSLENLAQQLSARDDQELLDKALFDLAHLLRRAPSRSGERPDEVHRISAPVFDRQGQVQLTLTVVSRDEPFAEDDVASIGQRLLTATGRVGFPAPTAT